MLEEANISNAYMKHIKWPIVFLLINLGIVSGVIISFLNLLYPMVVMTMHSSFHKCSIPISIF